MRTIVIAYGPEDLMEFAKAHLAPHAWQAIDHVQEKILRLPQPQRYHPRAVFVGCAIYPRSRVITT